MKKVLFATNITARGQGPLRTSVPTLVQPETTSTRDRADRPGPALPASDLDPANPLAGPGLPASLHAAAAAAGPA